MAKKQYNELFNLAEQIRQQQRGMAGVAADTVKIIGGVAKTHRMLREPDIQHANRMTELTYKDAVRDENVREQRVYDEAKWERRDKLRKAEKEEDRIYQEGKEEKRRIQMSMDKLDANKRADRIRKENELSTSIESTLNTIAKMGDRPDANKKDLEDLIKQIRSVDLTISPLPSGKPNPNGSLQVIAQNNIHILQNKIDFFDDRDSSRDALQKSINDLEQISNDSMTNGQLDFSKADYKGVDDKIKKLSNAIMSAKENKYIEKDNIYQQALSENEYKINVLKGLKSIDASAKLNQSGIDPFDMDPSWNVMPMKESITTPEGKVLSKVGDVYNTVVRLYEDGKYKEAAAMLKQGDTARQQAIGQQAWIDSQKEKKNLSDMVTLQKEKAVKVNDTVRQKVNFIKNIQEMSGLKSHKDYAPIKMPTQLATAKEWNETRSSIAISILNEMKKSRGYFTIDPQESKLASAWAKNGYNGKEAQRILNAIKTGEKSFKYHGTSYDLTNTRLWSPTGVPQGQVGGGTIYGRTGYEGTGDVEDQKGIMYSQMLDLYDYLASPEVLNVEALSNDIMIRQNLNTLSPNTSDVNDVLNDIGSQAMNYGIIDTTTGTIK